MIEGLRVLPHLQDALNEQPDVIPNCTDCQRTMPEKLRQRMACGFLPPVARARAWDHEGALVPPPSVCPRYTVDLPDVVDAARAWSWFEKGSLRDRLGPDQEASTALLDGIEIFNGAITSFRSWKADQPPKKGNG